MELLITCMYLLLTGCVATVTPANATTATVVYVDAPVKYKVWVPQNKRCTRARDSRCPGRFVYRSVPPRPTRNHVWIEGRWVGDTWVSGHWRSKKRDKRRRHRRKRL